MQAYLLLSNGERFFGQAVGASGIAVGEVVFNTAMTGYQEVLTDPSYFGQIVTMTYPLIGNYGINQYDAESAQLWPRGFIARSITKAPSNFRCEETLEAYLKRSNIVGLQGIDTRALTIRLREHGVMNGAVVSGSVADEAELLERIRAYRVENAVENVTCTEITVLKADDPYYRVGLYDFGQKRSIADHLRRRGCDVTILPASTSAQQALDMGFNGIMLSNGPGDPAANPAVIEELYKLFVSGIPIFGICLGHQLLAMAAGAQRERLRFGHRGGNHPVRDVRQNRTYITSQNHGYAIMAGSLDPAVAEVSHINMNDQTVEGIVYKDKPIFTVQFHPEAAPGPLDTRYLFDRFIDLMQEVRRNA